MNDVVLAAANGGMIRSGEQNIVVAAADGPGLDPGLDGIRAAAGDEGVECAHLNRI